MFQNSREVKASSSTSPKCWWRETSESIMDCLMVRCCTVARLFSPRNLTQTSLIDQGACQETSGPSEFSVWFCFSHHSQGFHTAQKNNHHSSMTQRSVEPSAACLVEILYPTPGHQCCVYRQLALWYPSPCQGVSLKGDLAEANRGCW